jgi:hypothetical protein
MYAPTIFFFFFVWPFCGGEHQINNLETSLHAGSSTRAKNPTFRGSV